MATLNDYSEENEALGRLTMLNVSRLGNRNSSVTDKPDIQRVASVMRVSASYPLRTFACRLFRPLRWSSLRAANRDACSVGLARRRPSTPPTVSVKTMSWFFLGSRALGNQDRVYYFQRAAEEAELAAQAADPSARAAHLLLQRGYTERASIGERAPPPAAPAVA